jgi:integrase
MPRTVVDHALGSPTARARLKPRAKPYWREVEHGLLHVGYRKGKNGGRWVMRRYLGGQRYLVETIGTADDNLKADGDSILDFKQAQAKARARLAPEAAPEELTLEAAIMAYADDLRARKGEAAARELIGRETATGWRGGRLRPLLTKHGGRRLADLTTDDLTKWRNGMVDADGDEDEARRSRDTANRVLTMAKAAFNFAFNNRQVADDRAWRVVKPFKGVGDARKVILGEGEIQRLADACDADLRDLVLAGALIGARLGELTNARVRDFDADAAILTVSGKTGERPIHLPPAAVALLRRCGSGKRPQDHLLTTLAGTPWTKSLHSRPLADAASKAGLDPATVFYSLRHSWISRALKAGVPTKAVADHCGTSIMMLQRYYAKFIPGDQQRYAAMAAPALEVDATPPRWWSSGLREAPSRACDVRSGALS